MEFLKRQNLDQGNAKIMSDILALLDGLTIQQAESVLNNLSIEIKKSKVRVADIQLVVDVPSHAPLGGYNQAVGKKELESFNPMP